MFNFISPFVFPLKTLFDRKRLRFERAQRSHPSVPLSLLIFLSCATSKEELTKHTLRENIFHMERFSIVFLALLKEKILN